MVDTSRISMDNILVKEPEPVPVPGRRIGGDLHPYITDSTGETVSINDSDGSHIGGNLDGHMDNHNKDHEGEKKENVQG